MIPIKLLVVDDDHSLCGSLKQFFERKDYRVETAYEGSAAIRTVSEFRPDIMFLDIGLPGMSGMEVLREVKKIDPGVRVLMITGQTEDELRRQARVLGSDDYITKPFTLEYLSGPVMEKLQRLVVHDYHALSDDLGVEKEKFEQLFKATPEGVLLLDRQGMILQKNDAAGKLLGLAEEDIILHAADALRPFLFQPARQSIMSPLPPQQPITFDLLKRQDSHHFDIVRPSPRNMVLEGRLTSVLTSRGEIKGHLLYLRDVSEERRDMTDMKRLINILSHKIRTPLAPMGGYLSMLMEDRPKDAEFLKRAYGVMQANYERLKEAVDGITLYGSLTSQKMEPEPVLLETLLDAARTLLVARHRAAGPIKWSDQAGKTTVLVDPARMQTVFYNLFENAFKFGSKSVEVAVHRDLEGYVTVEVADNGHGIPPEAVDRIFEWFYQVDQDFTGQVAGMGLGLSVVQRIVETHGGRVWVKSELEKGSRFFVSLPASS